MQVEYAIAVLLGYALGSIPVSLLVARAHGVDLRRTGDGNPGAWNALEQLGARRALPAFLGDAAKASLATGIGLALGGIWVGYAAAAAAMVGHAAPAFARLRGGKAVMSFVGAALVLSPLAGAVALTLLGTITWLASAVAHRATRAAFALGARVGVFAYPVAQLAVDPIERVAATGGLMTLVGALFLVGALRSRRSVRASSDSGAGSTR